MLLLHLLQCSRHRVGQRQNNSDYDYSKSDKLCQIVWPFSVGVSLFKKTRGATAWRCCRFHVLTVLSWIGFELLDEEVRS